MQRIHRHLFFGWWHSLAALPEGSDRDILEAVRRAEDGHDGQIRLVIEGRRPLHKLIGSETPRSRAVDLFAWERVWDTEHNNGVLLYLLLAERDAEIVADRGLNNLVSRDQWEEVCRLLEGEIRSAGVKVAVCKAVERIGKLLQGACPVKPRRENELPDDPVIR